jgi:SAM-dependent methyltransferase
MHYSVWWLSHLFFSRITFPNHDKQMPLQILDFGSFDVNGNLRSALHTSDLGNMFNYTYTGVDQFEGPNVDLVVDPSNKSFPFSIGYFDLVVTSSAFEHDPRFFLTFLKLLEVTKPGGYVMITVPLDIPEHRYPVDCWRFLPDAGEALASWGRENNFSIELISSFEVNCMPLSAQRDTVAIFYMRDYTDTIQTVVDIQSHFSDLKSQFIATQNSVTAVLAFGRNTKQFSGMRMEDGSKSYVITNKYNLVDITDPALNRTHIILNM